MPAAEMIKVTVGSTTVSKSVIVSDDTVIRDLLNQEGINTTGCSVTLNSNPISDLSKTLKAAGARDDSFLFAVLNSKNA